MSTPSLPDTLSDTLTLAISDARTLDRTLYLPHYRFWHGYESSKVDQCLVCLAGSIISKSFKTSHNIITTPNNYPDEINLKLCAINACRSGDFKLAFCLFHNCELPADLQIRFINLPKPVHVIFIGWKEFTAHLNSLEAIIPALREVENHTLSTLR